MAKRPRHPMSDHVAEALEKAGLRDAYDDRPAYQRNDYLRWIAQAKRDETRDKRLRQMLEELKAGDSHMGMGWRARRRSGGAGELRS